MFSDYANAVRFREAGPSQSDCHTRPARFPSVKARGDPGDEQGNSISQEAPIARRFQDRVVQPNSFPCAVVWGTSPRGVAAGSLFRMKCHPGPLSGAPSRRRS